MISVARREIKYLLDEYTSSTLRANLKAILPVDRDGNVSGYMVRSLYFDTVHNSDYYDKMDGLETRHTRKALQSF